MLVTQCKQEQILCYQHVKTVCYLWCPFYLHVSHKYYTFQSQFTKNKIDKLSTSLQ